LASADKEQLAADLSAYLDHELDPQRARQIERLLEESQDARRLLAELRAVAESVRDLPRMRAPETLAGRIRRAAERRGASGSHVPAQGVRVLRLVTRVVASAAVIVICTLAGWMMRDRVVTPGRTATDAVARGAPTAEEQAGRIFARNEAAGGSAPPAVTSPKAPAVAMKELKSLGYVGAATRADTELARAPLAGDALSAGGRGGAQTGGSGFTFGAVAAADDTSPVVHVVVAPRDADQFTNTLQLVTEWRQVPLIDGAPIEMVSRGSAGIDRSTTSAQPEGKTEGANIALLSPQEFTVRVSPARVGEALQSLEQRAPQQVQVVMTPNDLTRVQQLAMLEVAAAPLVRPEVAESQPVLQESVPTVALAETPAQERVVARFEREMPESRRIGPGGARGRVTREGVPRGGDVPRPVEVAGGRGAGAAKIDEVGREKGLPETSPSTRQLGDEAVGKKDARPPEPGMGRSGDMGPMISDKRCPRVAEVARPTSELIEQSARAPDDVGRPADEGAAEEEGAVEELPAAGDFVFEQTRELRERMGEAYEAVLDAARHPASSRPAGLGSGSVTLRVTVLSPPVATQPVSTTSSPATP
jgi:hypothetical protein